MLASTKKAVVTYVKRQDVYFQHESQREKTDFLCMKKTTTEKQRCRSAVLPGMLISTCIVLFCCKGRQNCLFYIYKVSNLQLAPMVAQIGLYFAWLTLNPTADQCLYFSLHR